MAQEMLSHVHLTPVPLSDFLIKKEPLYLVWKTCRYCAGIFELWSDNLEDIDAYWCNQCITQTKYKQMKRVWTVTTTETSTTNIRANNTPHLSIRWSQPLCVSSCVQQQPTVLY